MQVLKKKTKTRITKWLDYYVFCHGSVSLTKLKYILIHIFMTYLKMGQEFSYKLSSDINHFDVISLKSLQIVAHNVNEMLL